VSFALAMLAKSIVMTLPLLLVVMTGTPCIACNRYAGRARAAMPSSKNCHSWPSPWRGSVSYWSVATTTYPLPSRIAMALLSMVFYVSKTVLPIDLSPLYSSRCVSIRSPQFSAPRWRCARDATLVALPALACGRARMRGMRSCWHR